MAPGTLRADAALVGARKAECARLEPLVPEGVAVAVPVEDLEAIAAARAEDEEVAAARVLAEHRLRHLREPVEAAAHVCGRGRQPDAWCASVEL